MQKGQCQKKTQFINIITMDLKIFKMLKVHLEFRYFAQISRLKKLKSVSFQNFIFLKSKLNYQYVGIFILAQQQFSKAFR